MKKVIASVCLLSALASIMWILLYTLLHDLVESPFGEISVWAFKLFIPSVIFSLSCLGYVRIRRAMDKEKIHRMENTEVLLRHISATLTQIVFEALNREPNTKEPFVIDDECAAEIQMYYATFVENGGDQSKIPRSTRSFIAALAKPRRSAMLPS